jgi:hypothetical protein
MPTTQDLYDEWIASPDRPVLLVDETREHAPSGHGEFILFTSVQLNVEVLNVFLNRMQDERSNLPKEMRDNSIKGKNLFGNRVPPRYDPIAAAARDTLRRADAIVRLLTTSKHIKDTKLRLSGKITSCSGEVISGPELVPVLNFLKWVAVNICPEPRQVDVVIDRSQQLGLDPRQLGIKEEKFSVLGPGYLNTATGGGPTSLICSSLLRIIAGSDDLSGLRDLLLLPDAAGYLGLFKPDMKPVKNEVLTGTQFRIVRADMGALG